MAAQQVSGHVRLVERQRGPDKWYAKYRYPDATVKGGIRQVQVCLGPAWKERGRPPEGYYTAKMAEQALQDILTDARRGAYPGAGATGATLADAAAEYLRYVAEVRQIDPDTVADYRGVIHGDGYLLAELGADTPIEDIAPEDVERYRDKLMKAGDLSNRTIVRHLTVLHGIFKRAKRKWGLAENPASADVVERPKVVYTGEFDTFDRDEIELLATAATSAQDAAIYRVAAYTGLRQGELLALRWEHVDFMGGLLHVRRNFTGGVEKVPKGKRVRSVPMMADVIDALAALKEREHFTEDGDLVFVSETGGHVDHYELRKRYYAALESAGLRRVRFHDLRHAFGTAAIQKLDAYSVQSYMGHQHYSTTQRYLHHKPRREDAAALAEAFGASANRVPNRVPNSATSDATERS